ncbi:MAG: hypothetical protein PHC61_02475 [Chitinivibrionales bacterium]|nr:hypothetical protein [Chitinivibrionales bacterium]
MIKNISPNRGLLQRFSVVVCMVGLLWGHSLSAPVGNGGYSSPYFQADYIQDLSEFSSGLVNPALLYRINQMRVEAAIYRWGVNLDPSNNQLGYQEVSFLYPFRLNHTFGLSVIGTNASVPHTAIGDPSHGYQIQDLGSLPFGDLWVIGQYAIHVNPWLALGSNAKLLLQNRYNQNQQLVSFDLGAYINPFDNYRDLIGDLGLSINLQDFLHTSFLGAVAPLDTLTGLENTITTRARTGLRWAGFNDKLIVDGELVLDDAFAQLYQSAKESYDSSKLVIIPRFGVNARYMFIHSIWFKAGWTNNNIPYIGFNFNLIYPLPEMINFVSLDYNLGYSITQPERGLTMMARAASDFGYTREQIESKRLYDRLILAPMDAYNEAMRLYLAGKYWLASFAFGKVISLYPNFYLNDKAMFYLGNCYRFLYMDNISREIYKQALEEFTTSEVRSKYLYGLQSLDYREGKYDDALKNHAFITNLYGESEIRPDADYLAGEIYFIRKNYNSAEPLLNKVPVGTQSYLYAQYTLAIINYENKKTEAAILNLTHVVSDTSRDPGVTLLQDAANLKLGHLYFERGQEGDLRKAVETYKSVPEGSTYGDEAMLGTAWAWIKVNQPVLCQQTVEILQSSHPESPYIPESYLLKGYSLMLQKRYPTAVTALQKCLDLCNGKFVTEADLQEKRSVFSQYEQKFQPTAEAIKKNALRKPTNRTLDERGPLQEEFGKFDKESKDLFAYTLLEKSHTKFFKRKTDLVSDAGYALAKATSMMKGMKQEDILKEQQQEQQKLDEQIKALQNKLQKTK